MVAQVVSLDLMQFEKQEKTLKVSTRITMGFPGELDVLSPHTGRMVRFVPIGPLDPRFCQDGWDGEMSIYRPLEDLPNVKYLVVHHPY